MIGIEQLGLSAQTAVVVVPLAVYFFILGLLNSQPRPQVLSGRTDFILLNAAFFPVFCIPAASYVATSAWVIPAALVGAVALAALLAPPRWGSWVIYNISVPEALRAVERALQAMGEPFDRRDRKIHLARRDVRLDLVGVGLLRNVTLSAEGKDRAAFAATFDARLCAELAALPTQATPAAVTFLLIATAMLVTPLGLFADRMPEMVRLITDLVK